MLRGTDSTRFHQDMTRDVLPKRQSESKTPECAAMLKHALQSVLFSDSSDEELDRLLFLMKRLKVESEQNVIKQGDLGDQFYVVQTGSLEVIVNTAVLGYLKPGDHFGELALIYDGRPSVNQCSVCLSNLVSVDHQLLARRRCALPRIRYCGRWIAMSSVWCKLGPPATRS